MKLDASIPEADLRTCEIAVIRQREQQAVIDIEFDGVVHSLDAVGMNTRAWRKGGLHGGGFIVIIWASYICCIQPIVTVANAGHVALPAGGQGIATHRDTKAAGRAADDLNFCLNSIISSSRRLAGSDNRGKTAVWIIAVRPVIEQHPIENFPVR